MADLKKWEIIVEATAFDGSQTFACEAKDEEEALAKFKAGKCEIIEVNIEVIGLSDDPMDIEESTCIESRLSGDVNSQLSKENAELREALSDLSEKFEHTINCQGKNPEMWGAFRKAKELLAKHK